MKLDWVRSCVTLLITDNAKSYIFAGPLPESELTHSTKVHFSLAISVVLTGSLTVDNALHPPTLTASQSAPAAAPCQVHSTRLTRRRVTALAPTPPPTGLESRGHGAFVSP